MSHLDSLDFDLDIELNLDAALSDSDAMDGGKARARAAVAEALELIQSLRLDYIRCALTGAPYAQLDAEEVKVTLDSMRSITPDASAERLVDMWQLKALIHNSQPSPALRGSDKLSLATLMLGKDGKARTVTYCLTRLFFPPTNRAGQKHVSSQRMQERMEFASQLFDALSEEGEAEWLDSVIHHLSAADAYCSLTAWQALDAFKSPKARYGIHSNAFNALGEWFVNPMEFEPTQENLKRLANMLLTQLCEVAGEGRSLPVIGDRLSREVLRANFEASPMLEPSPADKTPPKRLHAPESAADLANAPEWYRELNKAASLRIAWSATHGQGVKPQGRAKASRKAATPKTAKPAKTDAGRRKQQLRAILNDTDFDLDI